MIVIDASAVLALLLQTSGAPAVKAWIAEPGQTLYAPHLIDIEVAQVIRRYAAIGDMDERQGRMALAALADLPILRRPHHALLSRVWELRHNITAYDAVYVALAEALDAPLLTCDRRLASAAGHRARIVPV